MECTSSILYVIIIKEFGNKLTLKNKEDSIMSEKKELATQETTDVSTNNNLNVPMGFEDEDAGDMLVPRIKIVQTLSPERKEKQAEEGDIIDSLTKAKLNGKKFIPVFKYNSNIDWKDRSEGGGIRCMASDGRIGSQSDGTSMSCRQCGRCEFDNSKTGRDAIPKCTKYMNFFGFFEGERMPIILSFAKTNYAEGKKLFSLAKVTMQNMWNHGYTLNEKLMSKNGNEWYNIVVSPAGATSEEDREFGMQLFKCYRDSIASLNVDYDEGDMSASSAPTPDISNTEF